MEVISGLGSAVAAVSTEVGLAEEGGWTPVTPVFDVGGAIGRACSSGVVAADVGGIGLAGGSAGRSADDGALSASIKGVTCDGA